MVNRCYNYNSCQALHKSTTTACHNVVIAFVRADINQRMAGARLKVWAVSATVDIVLSLLALTAAFERHTILDAEALI